MGWFSEKTPGYTLLPTDRSKWQGMVGGDGFETPRAFKEQYLLGGSISRGFVKGGFNRNSTRAKLGDKVRKPDYSAGTLFTADANNLPGRHDCIRKGGKWHCVYYPSEYKKLKETLEKRARDDAKAKKEGKVYNANLGTHITKERQKGYDDATKKRVEAARKLVERKTTTVKAEPSKRIDYPVQLRIRDAQKILLNYMGDIVAYNTTRYGTRDVSGMFNHIIGYDGDPVGFLNTMTSSTKGQASPFVRATPAQLAALVPKIEFFEVTADPAQKDTKKREVVTPILFPSYTSGEAAILLGRGKAASVGTDKVSDILSARGTVGTDVGVVEFHWTYDNKDIGQNVLKAELTLHFGSAADVINPEYRKFMFMSGQGPQPVGGQAIKPPTNKGDPNTELTIAERITKLKGEIKDRKIALKKGEFEEKSTEALKDKNLQYRTLRVMVGWARPEGAQLPRGLEDDDFLSALSATTRLIDLNLLSYKLEFKQEGQVQLKLSYAGSIGVLLSDGERADVLRTVEAGKSAAKVEVPIELYLTSPTEESDGTVDHSLASNARSWKGGYINRQAGKEKLPLNAKEYVKRFSGQAAPYIPTINLSLEGVSYELATLRKMQSVNNLLRADSKKEPTPQEKKEFRDMQTYIRTAEQCLEEIAAVTRKARYSGFLDRLFHQKKLRVATLRTNNPTNMASSPAGRLALVANPTRLYSFYPYDYVSEFQEGDEIKKRMKKAAASATEKKKDAKPKPPGIGHINPDATIDANSITKLTKWDEVRLYYMRLGDIIDGAIADGIARDDYGIVLGSISPGQIGATAKGTARHFCIGDIPISMEYFGQWFVEEIVKKEATKMPVRSFIRSLLKDLVEPAIAARVKPGDRSLSNLRFEMTVARLYKPLQPGHVYEESDLTEQAARPPFLMPSKPPYQYLTIAVAQTNQVLKGNKAQDEQSGIYHLLLGADHGLVKKWSFSEKKIPYLRAMNISNARTNRALVLPQDVTLTMVGNTLFQNGQLIYINADMGLGTAVARELNLGGYYRVVKSENTINSQQYETELTCMWEAAPWIPEG